MEDSTLSTEIVSDKAMKLIELSEPSASSDVRRREPVREVAVPNSGVARLNALPLVSLLEIPWARKGTIITALLVSGLLGWAAIMVWPRAYVSNAELLFQVGRESVALDPSATTGQTMVLQRSQEEDINSALQILQSRRVLEMVVDEIGADAIESGTLPSDGPPRKETNLEQVRKVVKRLVNAGVSFTGLRDDLSVRELAIMELAGSVDFDAPKKSSVVTVRATSKTPEMAQAIADSVVRNFQSLHRESTRTEGSFEFFSSQTALATKRLTEAQERKRQFLSERKAVSLEAKHDVLKQQIAAIELDSLIANRDLEQAEAKSRHLQVEIDSQADVTIGAEQNSAGTTWAALRQRVNELELREVKEAVMYQADNPKLKATRLELAGARQIMADFQANDQRDTNLIPNPLKQKLQEELKLNDSNIAGIRAAIDLRESQLKQLKTEVDALLADTNQLAEIELDIAQYSENLRTLRSKQEEARVIDDMQVGGVTSVNQFQPATFVERPISPNKKLLMAGFLIMGLMVGIGLTYYREFNSGTFRSSELARLQLPVAMWGELPEQSTFRQRKSLLECVRDSQEMLGLSQSLVSEVLSQVNDLTQSERGISVGVIGVDPGCGASTVALALATTSSEDLQVATVLVEADRVRRTVSVEFGLNGVAGLLELAQGKAELSGCIQPACRQLLSVVGYSSATKTNERSNVTGEELAVALREIKRSSELAIVDLPAVSSLEKAVTLSQRVDYLVIVIQSGKTQVEAANRFLRSLRNSDVQNIGIVLNKSKPNWLKSLLKVR